MKKYLIPGAVLLVLLAGYFLFQISKSRTFQFFGGLTHRVETERKIVALTFDDAPTPATGEVLDILKEKQIKATFYVVGGAMEKYPTEAKAITMAGMELGNHSYSHQRRIITKSSAVIAEEIQKTNALIRQTGYEGEITFRPPNGKKLFGLPMYLAEQKIKTIMWDVEPDTYAGDMKKGTAKTDFLVNYTVSKVQPGSIILMHPFCTNCESGRQALPKIIDELQRRGYQFVTVSELLSGKIADNPARPTGCPMPPPEYLIRSNCPFKSAVIDGECRVVCPIGTQDNFPDTCQKDTDCDCSQRLTPSTKGKGECRCAGNECVVAEDKAVVKNWP